MRWRITVRGDDPRVELRGYVDGVPTAAALADVVDRLGLVVIASPADDTYDPFLSWEGGVAP